MTRALRRILVGAAVAVLAQNASAQPFDTQVQTTAAPAESRVEAAPQISTPADKGLAEEQISTARSRREAVGQITRVVRSAQAPEALSDRSAGRTGAVEPVTGKDRCDPRASTDKRIKICSDVIESCADEFRRPMPTDLSPEQRLLLTRQIEGGGKTVADATRRLADTGDTGNDLEKMGIASIVLAPPEPAPKPQKPTDPTLDAATQAIIQAVTNPH